MEGSEVPGAPEVRVVVVDDQAPFRAAARAVLARTPGFALVGEAPDGEQALALVEQARPDALERREVQLAVSVEVGELHHGEAPVLADHRHDQVEDADDAAVREVDEGVEPLTSHVRARYLDGEIVDRSYVHLRHRAPSLACPRRGPVRCRHAHTRVGGSNPPREG